MLSRASVRDIRDRRLSRRYGYLVVVMQYYPRFLARTQIDEYVRSLAPSRDLFANFKAKERETKDHNLAFQEVSYEARFMLSREGKESLRRLCELAMARPVYFLCQCLPVEKCHADLLLLTARHFHQAEIGFLRQKYPIYEQNLRQGE
jgi:uncharacterized protein YeaO (DUF488 family)